MRKENFLKFAKGLFRSCSRISSKKILLVINLFIVSSFLGCSFLEKRNQTSPTSTSEHGSPGSKLGDRILSEIEKIFGKERDPELIKILIGGDVMFNWGIRDTIKHKGTLAPVEELKDLFEEADFRMLNLETPVVSEKSWDLNKSYVFQAKEQDLESLSFLNVDLVFLGNNHAMDHGVEGLEETRKYLKKKSIYGIGAGMNLSEAMLPWSTEKSGTKLRVYSATNVAENRDHYAGLKPGVFQFNLETVFSLFDREEGIVRQAKSLSPVKVSTNISDRKSKKKSQVTNRKQGKKKGKLQKQKLAFEFQKLQSRKNTATWMRIFSVHWGTEYSPVPTQEQREQAKVLLESGVQVIVGHHPHIPQGIEKIGQGIVFYSLGNLIFGSRNSYLNHNLIAILYVKKGKLQKVELIPIFGKFQNDEHIVRPLEGEEARSFLHEIAVLSQDLGTTIKIEGERGWIEFD
ncbi:metallophosphatase [Leptospira perolatii]|uniref:Metallophosphatase n=1 Tax=Leptospira perolatii TaxID=2023191 RepID=A0A2M9ZLK2_9LEPT|nr:CapA family protein [Leptospira perolatii]PJZ70255.1 metallophosphatase [Leptospira perolatii]PJZ72861.1 metallophosphatase [Leptospira perolatii]